MRSLVCLLTPLSFGAHESRSTLYAPPSTLYPLRSTLYPQSDLIRRLHPTTKAATLKKEYTMPWQTAPPLIIIAGAFNVAAGLMWGAQAITGEVRLIS